MKVARLPPHVVAPARSVESPVGMNMGMTSGEPPYYFSQMGHLNQSREFESMISEYNNGTAASNTTVALQWFHEMNEELVNMTFYVYLYQAHAFFVTSPHVNGNDIINYQENVIGAGSQIFYNLMAYNSTTSG